MLNAILIREPFAEDTRSLFRYCVSTLDGYIAAHSITNIFYILHESLNRPLEECRENIIKLCSFFNVVFIGKDNILRAVQNLSFNDFEDALQTECADEVAVDFIVTRNPKDFVVAAVPVITPKDILDLLRNGKI